MAPASHRAAVHGEFHRRTVDPRSGLRIALRIGPLQLGKNDFAIVTVVGDGNSTPDELVGLLSAADPAAMFVDGELIELMSHRIELPASRVVPLSLFPALLEEFDPLAVYPDIAPETLALITCGGEFNNSTRRYKQNIVVYAVPIVEATDTLPSV